MCNTLETHIELISLRNDGETNRVEHYYKEYDEKYNLGLVKGHYFINDYTELTSYCLGNYEEVKYIKDCNKIYKEFNEQVRRVMIYLLKPFNYLRCWWIMLISSLPQWNYQMKY